MQNTGLGLIEKWINEHGSAAIIKEYNSFLHAQLSAAHHDFSELEKERDRLKSEVAELKQSIGTIHIELQDANGKLKSLNARYYGLDDKQLLVLRALSLSEWTKLGVIAMALSFSIDQTLFYLVELKDNGYIETADYTSDRDWHSPKPTDTHWRLRQRGQRYLIKGETQ